MKSAKTDQETSDAQDVQAGGDEAEKAKGKKASRLERLKNKIKKLQGKDPDIYPMW